MLTGDEKDQLFREIWRGIVTAFSPSITLYDDTKKELRKSIFKGFGGEPDNFPETSNKRNALLKLDRNIQVFSAAKTFQQTKDMSNLRFNPEGFTRPFTDFKADAQKIFGTFNEQWLKTEQSIAVAQAQSSVQWKDIQQQKEDLPLLQYVTAGDNLVRDQHRAWDGIVRSVDDPWWDTHMPPNDFGCRCIAIQVEEGDQPITNLGDHLEKVKRQTEGKVKTLANDSKLYSMNAGKDIFVFREKGPDAHPYFKVEDRFEVIKKNNFNLPLE